MKTGSTITSNSPGYTTIFCDVLTKKIVFSLPNYKLEDYQERLDINNQVQYVSRFKNIMVIMSKKDTQPLTDDSLKTSNLS
jgi:3-methyladenine DNA glycosylase AlkD